MENKMDSLKPAEPLCAALEQKLKLAGIPVLTIAESANQAIRETVARRERIERLQAEFDKAEIDSVIATPATPESLNRLAEQIKEAWTELQSVPQGWRKSKEFNLAADCLEQLLTEFHYQADSLGVGIV